VPSPSIFSFRRYRNRHVSNQAWLRSRPAPAQENVTREYISINNGSRRPGGLAGKFHVADTVEAPRATRRGVARSGAARCSVRPSPRLRTVNRAPSVATATTEFSSRCRVLLRTSYRSLLYSAAKVNPLSRARPVTAARQRCNHNSAELKKKREGGEERTEEGSGQPLTRSCFIGESRDANVCACIFSCPPWMCATCVTFLWPAGCERFTFGYKGSFVKQWGTF